MKIHLSRILLVIYAVVVAFLTFVIIPHLAMVHVIHVMLRVRAINRHWWPIGGSQTTVPNEKNALSNFPKRIS